MTEHTQYLVVTKALAINRKKNLVPLLKCLSSRGGVRQKLNTKADQLIVIWTMLDIIKAQ